MEGEKRGKWKGEKEREMEGGKEEISEKQEDIINFKKDIINFKIQRL